MRLLHTADWHLGRGFHGASLMAAHAAVLDHLVEVAASERPDAVLLAGDVFDRAYPPLEAVELYDDVVARIAELSIPLVVTSGNHDSPIRLGMLGRVATAAGVHVRTRPREIGTPVQIRARGEELLVYPIPYLDPPLHARELEAEPTHAGVLGAAIARIAADRAGRSTEAAVVAIAHGVVAGGRPVSEEGGARVERSIDVGGVSAVPPRLFADLDYVALGHLHRPQGIGERIRYSGAPLAFGFDEAGEQKSLALVGVRAGGAPTVELLPTPQERGIARLEGTLEELLTAAEHADAEDSWVEATLTDRLRPRLAMEQLRRRYPHVLKIEHRPSGPRETQTSQYGERIRGRDPIEVAEQFLADVRAGVEADEPERDLLRAALEHDARVEARS
ncbi:MAG: exonuclease SbcCD subunit D [Patulibacter minatonensis]